jgi:hypothetical protein
MDMEALARDLHRALDSLPEGFVDLEAIARRIVAYRSKLENVVPDMIEILKPHIGAGMVEASMGLFNDEAKRELELTVLKVFAERGVRVDAKAG